MTTGHVDGIAALEAMTAPPGPPEQGTAYDSVIRELRGLLDAVACASPDVATCAELAEDLAAWKQRLQPTQVNEAARMWGHWMAVPGRAQALVPAWAHEDRTGEIFSSTVEFGRFHVGENGAAHGGAIALLFDEFLGGVPILRKLPWSRTAYLKTDYRSVTPIGVPLQITAWLERLDGRKQFVRGQLHDGDRLCAQAEGLWVALRPGQP